MKKPKQPLDWIGPFNKFETAEGWVVEGRSGLIIIERRTELEAELLTYALNVAYPVRKR